MRRGRSEIKIFQKYDIIFRQIVNIQHLLSSYEMHDLYFDQDNDTYFNNDRKLQQLIAKTKNYLQKLCM